MDLPRASYRSSKVPIDQLVNMDLPGTSNPSSKVYLPIGHLVNMDLPRATYRSSLGPVVSDGDLLMTDVRRQLRLQQDSTATWSRLNLLLGFVSNEGINNEFQKTTYY